MKINVLTPIRGGGPYNWGRDLVGQINKGGLSAQHIHRLSELLVSPLYQEADIIHTAVPLAFRLWKKPVIFTVCADYNREKNIWRLFTPMAIDKADCLTTRSHFLKERLNLKDAIVIPNAVFPEEFEPVKHSEKETINLVTVTNFYFQEKAKGILNILKVLESVVKETGKQINYSVIGDGPHLKRVMEAPRPEKINLQFLGILSSPKRILEHSDIFLYYSHQDNFPIAILEAMSCGLPVITNNIGAVSEIIESGRDSFIAPDDGSYLECLLDLIKNPDLRTKIAKNSRETVESKFNWAKVIDQYFALYNRFA